FALPVGPRPLEVMQTLRCLANGFLISGLLWAAALAMILDGRLRSAAGYFLVAAGCTLIGIIHSPLPDERIDLPWSVMTQVPEQYREAVRYQTPYHWAGAYVLTALVLMGLSLRPGDESATREHPEEEQLPASLPPIAHASMGGEGIAHKEQGIA